MKKLLISTFLLFSVLGYSQNYDEDLLTPKFHEGRREALRNLLPDNSCAVFFASPERKRANDTKFVYHQDPDFYYLTGLTEPNSMLIIFKEPQTFYDTIITNELIFVQERNPSQEVWTGRLLGKEGVQKIGFKWVFINSDFADFKLNFSLFNNIYHSELPDDAHDDKNNRGDLCSMVKYFHLKTEAVHQKMDSFKLMGIMASLREVKQPEELVLMRKAIDMTCTAHAEVMRSLEPGMTEYQAQAVAEYMFKKKGSEYVGYPSIVGGGENSCILHYETNRKKLEGEDHLLVIDAGAEYHGYAADITRTFPIRGVFSMEEKIIYEIVLEAQQAGIKACMAGAEFRASHKAAVEVIQKRLLEIGLIKKREDYLKYFFHGTSHYLGLDVHDAGNYGKLAPGNIITVEPGIYIAAGSDCDSKWWNIGVRIEDDVLITTDDPEVLSGSLPKTVLEIEALMKEESFFNKIK